MGLDILALEDIELVKPKDEATDEDWDNYYCVYSAGFLSRLDQLAEGFYSTRISPLRFRAGSYSGYNWWREQLCRFALAVIPDQVWANPDLYEDEPFYELINMSDCEGAIGPQTAEKLTKDFAEKKDLIEESARNRLNEEEADYFMQLYHQWHQAFEKASHNGVVIFA